MRAGGTQRNVRTPDNEDESSFIHVHNQCEHFSRLENGSFSGFHEDNQSSTVFFTFHNSYGATVTGPDKHLHSPVSRETVGGA